MIISSDHFSSPPPFSYTSYIAPITTHCLYTELARKERKQLETPVRARNCGRRLSLCRFRAFVASQIPSITLATRLLQYVVLLHNHYLLDRPQPLFRFDHPNPTCTAMGGADNTRYA